LPFKPLLLAAALFAATSVHARDRFDVAITVDDLPAHGPLPAGMTRAGIASLPPESAANVKDLCC
jgi:hypothetical protein